MAKARREDTEGTPQGVGVDARPLHRPGRENGRPRSWSPRRGCARPSCQESDPRRGVRCIRTLLKDCHGPVLRGISAENFGGTVPAELCHEGTRASGPASVPKCFAKARREAKGNCPQREDPRKHRECGMHIVFGNSVRPAPTFLAQAPSSETVPESFPSRVWESFWDARTVVSGTCRHSRHAFQSSLSSTHRRLRSAPRGGNAFRGQRPPSRWFGEWSCSPGARASASRGPKERAARSLPPGRAGMRVRGPLSIQGLSGDPRSADAASGEMTWEFLHAPGPPRFVA